MVDLIKLGGATVIDRAKGKPDALHIITPINIVSDMIDLLDSNLWTKDTKFLDIACKSGNFLRELYSRLMKHERLIAEFPDDVYRSEWILSHQLYGIAFSELDAIIATRNVYGVALCASNIKCMPNYIDLVKSKELYHRRRAIEIVKETFGVMKFDVIVGNPPYNNDLYIDFVLMSKQLVCGQGNICMITPAKWQAKGGEKNEQFRREIVPYMSDIVYYPDAFELFNIREQEGITYYNVDKCQHNIKRILCTCAANSNLTSSIEERSNINQTLFGTSISGIIDKCSEDRYMSSVIGVKQSEYVSNTEHGNLTGEIEVYAGEKLSGYIDKSELRTFSGLDKYKVSTSVMPVDVGFDKDGKVFGLSRTYVIRPNAVPKGSFPVLMKFDTMLEANSFKSYCETLLIRFLYYIGICGKTISEEFWRFVPDPGKFDHIFTDEELYKKYNLTQDEIKLIESVIKERN